MLFTRELVKIANREDHRLAIVQTVEIFFSKSKHHTKKKLSSLIALLPFQTVWQLVFEKIRTSRYINLPKLAYINIYSTDMDLVRQPAQPNLFSYRD